MIYRKAIPDDINDLVEMRMAYLLEDQEYIKETDRIRMEKSLPAYYERHLNQDFFAYVAVNNKIVGTVFLVVEERPANPHFITGKIGVLMNVYTRNEYRRQGIARKLVSMVIDESKVMNLSKIELMATEDGYELYKTLGFKIKESEYVPMVYKFQR
ncbi:GNAT family N-acetyltransferase [Anaerocolumna sp. MB42-C2]|uniref:GNAT family N-acetyltransferase n=1 Tax=Anaerocolumna sp. MB42-C2 TaxID=3070997 RepID=UPI0027DFCB77|nr:GNAT family N-acetyltransferase [Anaerocolumna sp. MB42-C2]WMJ87471.1 GNAT family N-acetyltransferase [Anaerocolumna sp. MB42-C2]